MSFTKTRLGLVTFGRSASDIGSNLKKWKSGRQHLTEKRIRRIPHILDNVTNLEEGLQMAFDKFIEKKKKGKNRLTDVPKVVIIFTDGKTNNEARLKSLIKVIYAQGTPL